MTLNTVSMPKTLSGRADLYLCGQGGMSPLSVSDVRPQRDLAPLPRGWAIVRDRDAVIDCYFDCYPIRTGWPIRSDNECIEHLEHAPPFGHLARGLPPLPDRLRKLDQLRLAHDWVGVVGRQASWWALSAGWNRRGSVSARLRVGRPTQQASKPRCRRPDSPIVLERGRAGRQLPAAPALLRPARLLAPARA